MMISPRPFSTTGHTIWMTGLSGSGKSTLALLVADEIRAVGLEPLILDGDELRQSISVDLGFSEEDRHEQARRVLEVALAHADRGTIVVVSLVSPFVSDRDRARASHELQGVRFTEVYLSTPLDVCERRDAKGLYQRARRGELADFTGITSPYEPPPSPDLALDTSVLGVEECVQEILEVVGLARSNASN
jgi:bifunctional enzyme CysN/CysC